MSNVMVAEGMLTLVSGADVQASFTINDEPDGVLLTMDEQAIDGVQLSALLTQKAEVVQAAIADETNQDVEHVSWRDAQGNEHKLI